MDCGLDCPGRDSLPKDAVQPGSEAMQPAQPRAGAEVEGVETAPGFTLLDDVRCKKAIPLPDPKLVAQALGEIPFCKPLDR